MHYRKSIRLRGFDYSQRGVYYVSIATQGGEALFGHARCNQVVLSALGLMTEQIWLALPRHAAGLKLDQYRILPNHLHGLIVLTQPPSGAQPEAFGHPTTNSLPTIVRGFKAAVTREWRRRCDNKELVVWQGRYLERVVRSRQELTSMRCFVRDNLLWHRLCDRDRW